MESIVRFRFSYRTLLALSLLWIAACSSGDAPAPSPWGTPSVIQGGQTNAKDVRLAMTGTGKGIAVWRQDNGSGDYNIVSASYSAGTGVWSAPQVIQLGTGDADTPQVAVDGNGNAVAVWLQFYGFGRFQVWANSYNAALGAWGIPQAIQEGETDSLAPQAAMDASGNAMVVWYQDNGAYTYTIRANRYRARSGTWSGPQVIQAGVDDAAYPQVALDASGNAVAVWIQYNGAGQYTVRTNRYRADTDAWEEAQVIQMVAAEARDPQVGMDGAGNAVAIWIQDGGTGIYTVWASRYSAGVWTAPRVIQSGDTDATGPQVAVDSAGNAVSVWYQQESDTGDYTIRANRYAASAAAWGTPQVIQRGTDDAGFPQVHCTANGEAVAVWSQLDDSGVSQIWANRYSAGASAWNGAELVHSETTDALHPQVSLDGTGRAVAVWLQDDGSGIFTAMAAGSR